GVDSDEGSRGARTVTVQRPRNKLPSGSRFTRDQYCRARLRKAPLRTEDFLHRLRLTENFRDFAYRLLRRFALLAVLQRATDQVDGLIDVEGLRQVFVRSALECRNRRIEVRVSGHDDHGHRWMPLLYALKQLD